jgi:hypothetical protein
MLLSAVCFFSNSPSRLKKGEPKLSFTPKLGVPIVRGGPLSRLSLDSSLNIQLE